MMAQDELRRRLIDALDEQAQRDLTISELETMAEAVMRVVAEAQLRYFRTARGRAATVAYVRCGQWWKDHDINI